GTVLGFAAITRYAFRAEERRREAEDARATAQQSQEEAEAALYFQRVEGAFHEWQASDLEQAERLPDPHKRQARGHSGGGFVRGLCHAALFTLGSRSGDRMTVLAFSPDGRWLATGGPGYNSNGVIKLWDAATGQLVRTFQGRMPPVIALAFHPDSRRLVST